MRFLRDEGLPYRLAIHLQDRGHDVTAVGHDHPYSLADREILEIATAERRIVLTNDKDFGDLIFRDRLRHEGVVLFRLGYVQLDERIAYLERKHYRYSRRAIRLRRGIGKDGSLAAAGGGTYESTNA